VIQKPLRGYRALRKGRVSLPNAAYFITTRIAGRRPVLNSPANAGIVVRAIRWLRTTGRVWLLSYVVMPDHVHMLFALRSAPDVSKLVGSWKGYASRVLRRASRLRRPIWQSGFYDHMIRDHEDLRARLRYIHENPVRKGLWIVSCQVV